MLILMYFLCNYEYKLVVCCFIYHEAARHTARCQDMMMTGERGNIVRCE